MNLHLAGKTAVITGGAQGIGKAIAMAFAAEGCHVAVCDINKEALASAKEEFLQSGHELYTAQLDVCDSRAVCDFASDVSAKYGTLDIWINNAGILFPKPVLEQELSDFERVIRVNLSSVFNGTQAAGREMKKNGGVIINSSSFAGILPTAYRCSYAASKAGVIAFTKETAAELAPHQIRVVAIAPGMAEREEIISRIAMRRCAKPEEVADLAVFLASDAASYLTGAVYEITGGQNCIQDIMKPWGLA